MRDEKKTLCNTLQVPCRFRENFAAKKNLETTRSSKIIMMIIKKNSHLNIKMKKETKTKRRRKNAENVLAIVSLYRVLSKIFPNATFGQKGL